jgi:N-methylhydantoinase A/oxoprolinase/acetone carboxylase beta subunit
VLVFVEFPEGLVPKRPSGSPVETSTLSVIPKSLSEIHPIVYGKGISSMDGAGNIFDRIEQKLSALGVNADISDLQKAAGEYDAKIGNNPADLDSKIIDLELKVVMLARLLNASIDALETRGLAAAPATATQETDFKAPVQTAQSSGPVKKVKRLRQNPATGIIEEIEDVAEDDVIVADTRARFGGKGDPKKDSKKSVFIQATDDEPVKASEKARK